MTVCKARLISAPSGTAKVNTRMIVELLSPT